MKEARVFKKRFVIGVAFVLALLVLMLSACAAGSGGGSATLPTAEEWGTVGLTKEAVGFPNTLLVKKCDIVTRSTQTTSKGIYIQARGANRANFDTLVSNFSKFIKIDAFSPATFTSDGILYFYAGYATAEGEEFCVYISLYLTEYVVDKEAKISIPAGTLTLEFFANDGLQAGSSYQNIHNMIARTAWPGDYELTALDITPEDLPATGAMITMGVDIKGYTVQNASTLLLILGGGTQAAFEDCAASLYTAYANRTLNGERTHSIDALIAEEGGAKVFSATYPGKTKGGYRVSVRFYEKATVHAGRLYIPASTVLISYSNKLADYTAKATFAAEPLVTLGKNTTPPDAATFASFGISQTVAAGSDTLSLCWVEAAVSPKSLTYVFTGADADAFLAYTAGFYNACTLLATDGTPPNALQELRTETDQTITLNARYLQGGAAFSLQIVYCKTDVTFVSDADALKSYAAPAGCMLLHIRAQ